MTKLNILNYSTSTLLCAAIFTGCSFKDGANQTTSSSNKTVKHCGDIEAQRSLEQGIKHRAFQQGFTAKINNTTDENPEYPKNKNLYSLNEYLDGLKVSIENYGDDSKIKQVYITSIDNKNSLMQEIKKTSYTFENNFISAGDIIRIYSMSDVILEMPIYLNSKAIKVTPDKKYSLYELVNLLSIRLNTKFIHTKLLFDNDMRKITLIDKPMEITGSKDTLDLISKELHKFQVPFKNGDTLKLLGSYSQQHFSKMISSRIKKYSKDNYVVCTSKNKEGFVASDNRKKIINGKFAIKISKIKENDLGISKYKITHYNIEQKTKEDKLTTSSKDYYIESNKKKTVFDVDNQKYLIRFF